MNHARLQLALVVIVAGVLVSVLLDRAERLAGEAEGIAVDLQVQSLNHLAMLRYAQLIATGDLPRLAAVEGANPMRWDTLMSLDPLDPRHSGARTQLGDYVGERSIRTEEDVERGRWAFDPEQGLLFYRFRFPPDTDRAESSALVGYRTELIFDDLDADGHFDVGLEASYGMRVVGASGLWAIQSTVYPSQLTARHPDR